MDLAELIVIVRSMWVVWLMILLGVIVFWAFRPKNRKRFEDDGMIPFRKDD